MLYIFMIMFLCHCLSLNFFFQICLSNSKLSCLHFTDCLYVLSPKRKKKCHGLFLLERMLNVLAPRNMETEYYIIYSIYPRAFAQEK